MRGRREGGEKAVSLKIAEDVPAKVTPRYGPEKNLRRQKKRRDGVHNTFHKDSCLGDYEEKKKKKKDVGGGKEVDQVP